jgi:predicted ATPase
MIQSVHVRNFKCLLDTRVEFREPLTAIVGANNTGKSCLVEALLIILGLRHIGLTNLFRGERSFDLVHTIGKQAPMEFEIRIGSLWNEPTPTEFEYWLSLSANEPGGWVRVEGERLARIKGADRTVLLAREAGKEGWLYLNESNQKEEVLRGDLSVQGIVQLHDREAHKGIRDFRTLLDTVLFFAFVPGAMKAVSAIAPQPVWASDGSNLTSILDWLKGEHDTVFERIERELRRMVPEVTSLGLKTLDGGRKCLAFQEAFSGGMVPGFLASDGLIRSLGFVAVLNDPRKPRTEVFEEPENGFHPRRLEQLVECWRAFLTGTKGSGPRQIITTTHSPYLLDKLRPEEVLVVTRDEGGTKIGPIANLDSVRTLLEDAPLGELWHRGTIGGVPSP